MRPRAIRVVVFRTGANWIGQCLEFDLATQAPTVDELDYQLQALLVGHIVASIQENKQPFENLPKAPSVFWQMFDSARNLEHRHIEFRTATRVKAPRPTLRIVDPVPPNLCEQLLTH